MNKDRQKSKPENEILSQPVKKGLSRRGFLRGAGLTTVGTMALQTGVLGESRMAEQLEDVALGPGVEIIKLKVNGKVRSLAVEPRTTLANALRNQFQLTGTKVVCDRGACAACTVWVDGKPMNSCLTLAVEVIGQEITTIEGVGSPEKLHPVQQAFIDHDASQCGFCTPGMIMTAVHFLGHHPKPNLDEVKVALRGNLCRCGTHPKVFQAVMDASKKI